MSDSAWHISNRSDSRASGAASFISRNTASGSRTARRVDSSSGRCAVRLPRPRPRPRPLHRPRPVLCLPVSPYVSTVPSRTPWAHSRSDIFVRTRDDTFFSPPVLRGASGPHARLSIHVFRLVKALVPVPAHELRTNAKGRATASESEEIDWNERQ